MKDTSFLTTEQVVDYLQVDVRTVYRLIRDGRLPAVRVGRQWRFRKHDIDAWLGGQPSSVSQAEPSPKVLVVDDQPGVRNLLVKILGLADYYVEVASDGREGLDRVRDHRYHLLITDLNMPGVDGLTLINEARRLDAKLPVIVITGHSTEATAIEAANLGVSGYLTKPFKLSTVLAATARALEDDQPGVAGPISR